MLLNIALTLRELNFDVTVVGPSQPSALVDRAEELGIPTKILKARNRFEWMLSLRRWHKKQTDSILWCNGLVPSVSTCGRHNRIVHLHQQSLGLNSRLEKIARRCALVTLVPSHSMARAVSGSHVLHNWVSPVLVNNTKRKPSEQKIIGFLGRPSIDKGVDVLAEALLLLEQNDPGKFRLLLAGEPRFVSPDQQKAVDAALKNITDLTDIPGWMLPQDFFEQVDIFVCPSVWPEPFGLVVTEAMSARVPIVLSDAGALPELVGEDYEYIVPAGDALALAQAIRAYEFDSDISVQERMHARWEELFSPQAGLTSVAAVMQSVSTQFHEK